MRLFPHLLLAIVWTAFCLLHSLLAAESVKQKIIPHLKKGGAQYRFLYTLFAAAGFIAIVLYQFSVRSIRLFQPPLFIVVTGIATGLCGVTIMAICIYRYFLQLSGLKGLLKNDTTPVLLQNGLHGWVRHPLYMGTFIFIWSLFLLFPSLSLGISNIIITVYTIVGARLEEKKLIREFGEAYNAYRQKVPMFIPH
jgi:methanethiol S-methyltransferase